jgi:hypothetical protein
MGKVKNYNPIGKKKMWLTVTDQVGEALNEGEFAVCLNTDVLPSTKIWGKMKIFLL